MVGGNEPAGRMVPARQHFEPTHSTRRQIDLLEADDQVRQETRHWNETDGRTHTLRTKEDADDYRYFLEPDLVPVDPSQEWISAVRSKFIVRSFWISTIRS